MRGINWPTCRCPDLGYVAPREDFVGPWLVRVGFGRGASPSIDRVDPGTGYEKSKAKRVKSLGIIVGRLCIRVQAQRETIGVRVSSRDGGGERAMHGPQREFESNRFRQTVERAHDASRSIDGIWAR